VEILNWLDDHSRLLLSCTAHRPVTGRNVVDTLTTVETYGPPASTLTDNGRVYTARHGGGRNEFEYLLAALNIRQKNGAPNHPQTQGKIERFHQTLKRWLAARPRAASILELQTQLDAFREHYNTARPHRARDGQTPATAYATSPKTAPAGSRPDAVHYRIRYDHVGSNGKISFRRAARMHHLGIGIEHRGNAASSSPTNTPSPSSTSTPAKSLRPTPSTPPEPTGETTRARPMAGLPLMSVTYDATQMSSMSRPSHRWT
jgi:hypothetical protein